MPTLHICGAHINYEILGDKGPWVALSPGGRRPLEGVKHLAERVAAHGYRVLIHDRRNCGASDVVFEGTPEAPTEYEIWAEDLCVRPIAAARDGHRYVASQDQSRI